MGQAPLRVLITGGGTGGHLYPGIAVAKCFQQHCPHTEVVFVGRRYGLEASIVPREGVPIYTVHVQALQGRRRPAQLWALGTLVLGTSEALWLLRRLRPHVVIGVGGYVMAPAVLAAIILGIPRVLLEQNVIPGFTVRRLAPYAQLVCTTFTETQAHLPGVPVQCTGTPVRPDICTRQASTLPASGQRLHLLVLGGSQGARRLNQAVIEALPLLRTHQQHLAIVHQTGETDHSWVHSAYAHSGWQAEVHPFLHDIARYYHWAHLVVCRAGASTLAELTACGKPAILVPYPHAASDHQYHNALVLQHHGAAQIIPDAALTGKRLSAVLAAILASPDTLREQAVRSHRLGKPQAATEIVQACVRLVDGTRHSGQRGLLFTEG